MFLTFSGHVSGLEDELKHIKTSLSKAEAEKRQLQEDHTALEKVCVCVCVWFMRTQICIMTWYYKEKVIYDDNFSILIIQKSYKAYRMSFFEKVKMYKVSCKG